MTTNEQNDSREQLYDTINKKIESLSTIKFAAYRVACKLRALQKYLKLCYVDYNVLVRAFNTHQLQFGVGTQTISLEDAQTVLLAIYKLISSYHFNESSIEEVAQTLLTFICQILEIQEDEELDLNSFKILLFALSSAKLPEKYRCFFRQITSPNVIASQVKLTELFEILLRLPNYFDDVESFHMENIPGCVQSCLDHTHDGVIREDIFVSWMNREPQTLVWLPTLHRLIATETIRHEAQCNTCKAYPIIGMRYRCLRCFNYDLCQTCFFTGDHTKNHDGSHPIEEYCKQVTPFEDLKAFFEFVKLKVSKNELKRKERYLTIERSKSFSDTPTHHSKQSETNGHHSLNRHEKSSKKIQSQDIYRSVPKLETNEKNSLNEQKQLPTSYDNVPVDEKKKTNGKKNNYTNVDEKKVSSSNEPELPDDVPMLMPKQHKPMKKVSGNKQQIEHYQSPPIDDEEVDNDDYRPPLPPKQRQQNNTSRALVYDFIGSELQELRATLAQFDGNSSTA